MYNICERKPRHGSTAASESREVIHPASEYSLNGSENCAARTRNVSQDRDHENAEPQSRPMSGPNGCCSCLENCWDNHPDVGECDEWKSEDIDEKTMAAELQVNCLRSFAGDICHILEFE